MSERDWSKDWEMCEKATPEPWEVEGAGGVYMDSHRDGYFVVHDGKRLHRPHFSREDARFIAESRQALPYWLQRVRELETRLQKALDACRWLLKWDSYCDALVRGEYDRIDKILSEAGVSRTEGEVNPLLSKALELAREALQKANEEDVE